MEMLQRVCAKKRWPENEKYGVTDEEMGVFIDVIPYVEQDDGDRLGFLSV